MRFQILFFIAIFIIALFLLGCPSSPTETLNTNTANSAQNLANTRKNNANNNPFNTTKKEEAATSNNAPTLAPVVQGFYDALKKKDEAGVKKYLSASALKYWEDEAKAEKKTWLAFLLESEEPVGEKREVRNEKIDGETAVAELKGGSLGVWTPAKFVKENGEWKFASPKDSISLQDIPRTNSNTAK